MTAAPYEDLLRRLRVLEDEEALRRLMIRGWRALDRKDWRAWIECWAEDAVLEFEPWGEIHGKEAIRSKVEQAEAHFPSMQHHILNMDFQVEGDRATGVGYMWFVAVTGDERSASPYSMGGPYDWDYRRTPEGGWLLTRQKLGVWWTDGEETPPGLG
ncbi:ketosteroid isomerase-like protein [Streptomyces sp. CG 926]|uniref:nuclear transport factor 2 family protein n=1 Tax=Streptomyces sp. CG 926 TaxID=1882405 RepID=UPI000D78DFB0|nr:nuclear transport factor 2 family protein [Streptomyces sp. CG 926]PWK71363.1 ketosteroid isomerase-like protein [Streptomyces sp. CG 926]